MSGCASFISWCLSCLSAARASILIWNTDDIKYDHFEFICKKKKRGGKKTLHRSTFLSDGKVRKSESSVFAWRLVFFSPFVRGVKTTIRLFFLRKVRRRAAKTRVKRSGGGETQRTNRRRSRFKKPERHKEKKAEKEGCWQRELGRFEKLASSIQGCQAGEHTSLSSLCRLPFVSILAFHTVFILCLFCYFILACFK